MTWRPASSAVEAAKRAKAQRRRYYAGITAPARRASADGPIFVPMLRISARRPDNAWHLRIDYLPDDRTFGQRLLGEPEPGRSALFLKTGAPR